MGAKKNTDNKMMPGWNLFVDSRTFIHRLTFRCYPAHRSMMLRKAEKVLTRVSNRHIDFLSWSLLLAFQHVPDKRTGSTYDHFLHIQLKETKLMYMQILLHPWFFLNLNLGIVHAIAHRSKEDIFDPLSFCWCVVPPPTWFLCLYFGVFTIQG